MRRLTAGPNGAMECGVGSPTPHQVSLQDQLVCRTHCHRYRGGQLLHCSIAPYSKQAAVSCARHDAPAFVLVCMFQADGERRKSELAKARADKADREAKALALVSVGAGRSTRSTRSRPYSAR